MKPHPTIPLALTALTATVVVLGFGFLPPAAGWTPEMHVEIARQAATIAPPDLFRQIQRHEKAFSAGLAASLGGRTHSDDGEMLLARVRGGSRAVVEAIESHQPFRDIVRELGRLAAYAAEANNPLEHSAEDPTESRYGADYESYVASAVPRFEVVFYGEGRDVRTDAELSRLLSTTRRRGAALYPLLGLEYRRIGKVDGIGLFDDKSTAFGVGAIAFSHAVSDLAAVYRYIWLRAGGGDPRELPITAPAAVSASAERATEPEGARLR